MSTIQGNHIGYNQVQVSQTGNGYTIYRYYGSNYWDNIISDVCIRTINANAACTVAGIPSFPAPPLPFDPMRGELKYEGHFNQLGEVLKEVTYTPVYALDPLTTPAAKYINIPGLYANTPYSLQSAKKVQTTVWKTDYSQTSPGSVSNTSITYYGSNYHHSPTRQVTTTSTGDSLATNTLYAADIRIASCDAIPDSSTYFNTITNSDTTQFFLHVGSCSASDWICRTDTFSNMRRHVNLARNQFVRYRRRSFFGPASLQGACYLSAEASSDTTLKPILRLKDEFNNPTLEVSSWRDNRLLHANFTQYDTSQSPIGFAYPAKTQLINLQASSSSFTPLAVAGHSLTKDSRYLIESLYTFTKGNPTQTTPHSGVTNSYLWDYTNKEPIAKVVNTTVDQVAYSSFEADGSGNWTIPSSSRDTGGVTGVKCYNLSSGSVSRSGLTTASFYVVSYWTKNATSYTVSGSSATIQGKTIAGWTYFEHTVTGVSSVTVSGSGDVDELRLYPQTAQMTTYTYTPLVGMSSQCDVDNRVTYYNYDALGRLIVIMDQDRNIVKSVGYHYKNQ
jgi:YD repeat-containing protein